MFPVNSVINNSRSRTRSKSKSRSRNRGRKGQSNPIGSTCLLPHQDPMSYANRQEVWTLVQNRDFEVPTETLKQLRDRYEATFLYFNQFELTLRGFDEWLIGMSWLREKQGLSKLTGIEKIFLVKNLEHAEKLRCLQMRDSH